MWICSSMSYGYFVKFSSPDVNECSGSHGCAHRCTNTQGSYSCTCNSGYRLGSDGRSCTIIPTTAPTTAPSSPTCGGRLTSSSGSFQTPGWPHNYPQQNFECEWVIDVDVTGYVLQFTIDSSAYGINGRSPCPTDYLQFFDGTSSSANSLHKVCQFNNPSPITTSSSEARVVFVGSQNSQRPASRVGARVSYTLTDIGMLPLSPNHPKNNLYPLTKVSLILLNHVLQCSPFSR